jgi:hypothetical protein
MDINIHMTVKFSADEPPRTDSRSEIPGDLRKILEYNIQEARPGFELVGMKYLHGHATGYFINPADLAYVHIWEIMLDPGMYPEKTIMHPDTFREIALMPIDGHRFPSDVILTKTPGELNQLGFDIPKSSA